jgi:hypothetical protein
MTDQTDTTVASDGWLPDAVVIERGVKGLNPNNPDQEWDIIEMPSGERWAFYDLRPAP